MRRYAKSKKKTAPKRKNWLKSSAVRAACGDGKWRKKAKSFLKCAAKVHGGKEPSGVRKGWLKSPKIKKACGGSKWKEKGFKSHSACASANKPQHGRKAPPRAKAAIAAAVETFKESVATVGKAEALKEAKATLPSALAAALAMPNPTVAKVSSKIESWDAPWPEDIAAQKAAAEAAEVAKYSGYGRRHARRSRR